MKRNNSEARYQKLIEHASDAIYVTDEAGRILEANQKTHEMLGYSTDEQLRLTVWDIVASKDRSGVEKFLQAVLAGETVQFEHGYLRKDGSVVIAENTVKLVAPGMIQVIARDITERKKVELALQESEARYRNLVETATEGIWVGDCDDTTLFVNDRFAEMLGYSVQELIGKSTRELIYADDLPLVRQKRQESPAGRGPGYDVRMQRKDGSLIWVLVSSRRTFDDNGKCTGRLTMLTDVTDRKNVEDRLQATADRLETILRSAPIGIGIVNVEGRLLETNTAFDSQLGYSSAELKAMRFQDYTHPDDVGRCLELFTEMVNGERDGYEVEKRYIRKDGTEIWGHLVASPLKTASGFTAIELVEDITERKKAYDQLRLSEARLNTFVESNVIGIKFAEFDGRVSYANDAFMQFIGYKREEFPTGMDWRNLTPSEFRNADEASVREIAATGAFRPYEKQYIRKDGSRISVLIGGAQYEENKAIVFVVDLSELKAAQREISRLARIVESAGEAIISVSQEGKILTWNKGAERLYGYTASEVVGQPEAIIIPDGRDTHYEVVRRNLTDGIGVDCFETLRLTKSKVLKPVSIIISPLHDEDGLIVGWTKIARDLTETKKAEKLEEQCRQAQKLEAVGRLAGGVAHDFNNLLMVISSYTEMMEERLEPDNKLRNNTREVLKATEKAASLTQQLLAFSRKQVLMPQVVDLNALLDDTMRMAKRLIGEDIEMSFDQCEDLWAIQADPGQITQIFLNLCVNARDAMPTGGRLVIETRNVEVGAELALNRPTNFLSGSYAVLSVTDTGVGMTEEIKEHIFEPFFSTKESRGTGLGLSTVYGIVKQSGGYIWVKTAPGQGSRFDVYFPKTDEIATAPLIAVESSGDGRGETILVVEDEESLRVSVCEYLADHGYKVLQAENGEVALDISARHTGPIHVLLTDVIMPKLSGVEVAKRLSFRSEMITIFMSGYTDDAIVNHGALVAGVRFIHKPFSLSTLGIRLREALGQTSGQASSSSMGCLQRS